MWFIDLFPFSIPKYQGHPVSPSENGSNWIPTLLYICIGAKLIHSHSQSPSTKGTPFLHQKMEAIGFQHCCTFVSVQLDSNTVVQLYRCQSDLIFGFGVKATQSGLPRIRTQNEGPCCFPPGTIWASRPLWVCLDGTRRETTKTLVLSSNPGKTTLGLLRWYQEGNNKDFSLEFESWGGHSGSLWHQSQKSQQTPLPESNECPKNWKNGKGAWGKHLGN